MEGGRREGGGERRYLVPGHSSSDASSYFTHYQQSQGYGILYNTLTYTNQLQTYTTIILWFLAIMWFGCMCTYVRYRNWG